MKMIQPKFHAGVMTVKEEKQEEEWNKKTNNKKNK